MGRFLNRKHRPVRKRGAWRENADTEAAERVRDAEEKEEKPPSPEIVKWRQELRRAYFEQEPYILSESREEDEPPG